MDLGLDITAVRTTGRAAKPVAATLVRELTPADLPLLAEEKGSRPPTIKRLSERHHTLARAVASGLTMEQAAAVAQYDISRVSVLKGDPTFSELVKFYSREKDAAYRNMHEGMAALGSDVVKELHTRLEEEPESFSVGQLNELAKTMADRTGFGPSTTSTQLNINVNLADRLAAARKRLDEARRPPMIEATAAE